MRQAANRGQSLLIASVSFLLLACMVMITLEIGAEAKRRMEAQVLADAAAYSQAINTARTFNELALLQRGTIAANVSLMASQSAISWAGAIRGNYGLSNNLVSQIKSFAGGMGCSLPLSVNPPNLPQWAQLDQNAGLQAPAAGYGWIGMMNTLLQNLTGSVANVPQATINAAFPSGTSVFSAINTSNVTGSQIYSTNGPSYLDDNFVHMAVMGSRGDKFVSNRDGGTPTSFTNGTAPFNIKFGPPVLGIDMPAGGGSGFGRPWVGPMLSEWGGGTSNLSYESHNAQKWDGMQDQVSWAEDDLSGQVSVSFVCAGATVTKTFNLGLGGGAAQAFIASDEAQSPYTDDLHWYGGAAETAAQLGGSPGQYHTMPTCISGCPGFWGGFFAYSAGASDQFALFGQPLMMAAINVNRLKAPNPWDIRFTISPFGVSFDSGSKTNAALQSQAAMSWAIAYYHRKNPNNYQEPPNFFNPFWRATLVSGTLGYYEPLTSVPVQAIATSAPIPNAAAANALHAAGFGGF